MSPSHPENQPGGARKDLGPSERARHAATGELYLIEINVRVPGAFGLAQACGVDGPWRLYASLAGIDLGAQPRQVDGRKMMLPHKEAAALAHRLRAGEVRPSEVLRSWRGVRDTGPVAIDDPMPMLALIARLARTRLPRIPARTGCTARDHAKG